MREKRVFVWGEVHPGLGELLLLTKEAFSESGERIAGGKKAAGGYDLYELFTFVPDDLSTASG